MGRARSTGHHDRRRPRAGRKPMNTRHPAPAGVAETSGNAVTEVADPAAVSGTADTPEIADVDAYVADLGRRARAASREMARAATAAKNRALAATAAAIRDQAAALREANAADLEAARKAGHDAAFVDRLALGDAVIASMAEGLEQIAALPDPIGEMTNLRYRPTGIQVGQMRVPL